MTRRTTTRRTIKALGVAAAWLLAAVMPAGADASAISVSRHGGSGRDVVLVAGLSSGAAVWDGLVRALGRDHRVHVVTLDSACRASGRPEAAPLDEAAGALQSFLSRLGRPATVIAHSAGGVVALQVALRAPSAFRQLLVIDAVPAPGMLFVGPGEGPAQVRAKAEAAYEAMVSASDAQRAAMLQQERRSAVQDADRAHELTQLAIGCDKLALAQATRDLSVTDLRDQLPRGRVPLTVVFADQASLGAPPGWMRAKYEKLYAGWGASLSLQEVTGSRHYVMLDQPAQLRRIVENAVR